MAIVTPVVAGIIGLAVGWALGVVIHRVPNRESVIRPRPHCDSCQAPLAVADLIPVLGWIRLRGRCRTCGQPIGWRYPFVEVANAALFVAAAIRFGTSWALPAFCIFFGALLAVSVIDLERMIIPNRIVYPTLAAVAPLLVLAAVTGGSWEPLRDAALGGAASFLALLVVHLVSPRGMGFGDVRLGGVDGVMLGWLGLRFVFLGVFVGFALGSVIGIGLIATRLRSRRDALPFGPFMAAGAVVVVLWGHAILGRYPTGRL